MIIRKKRKKKKRVRVSPWMIAAIVLLLGAIAFVLYTFLHNGREEAAEAGNMSYSLTDVNAVIIRDEFTHVTSELARTDFMFEEGESVSGGDLVAVAYKLGYSDELMQSLLNKREEVYAAQMERIGSTKDPKLDELNESIDGVKKRIEACVMHRSGEDLESIYRSLDSLLKERTEYLRGKVQETESLRQLYASADAAEDLITAWTEDIYAERDGRVSYYFDGYEQAMNVEKLGMLSSNLINRAVKESAASTWTADDATRVCRVVNNDKWFLAFTLKGDTLKRLAEGVEYDVEINGHGSHHGVAREPFVSGDEIVNLIEFDEPLGDLIEVRAVKVNVRAAVSGVKVKSNAIVFEEHKPYLELIRSGAHHAVEIDILAVEDGYAIIRAHSENDPITEGASYWNRKR